MKHLAEHVIEIDQNDALYEEIKKEPLFTANPQYSDLQKLKGKIKEMVKL
jgi:hypothetical protein